MYSENNRSNTADRFAWVQNAIHMHIESQTVCVHENAECIRLPLMNDVHALYFQTIGEWWVNHSFRDRCQTSITLQGNDYTLRRKFTSEWDFQASVAFLGLKFTFERNASTPNRCRKFDVRFMIPFKKIFADVRRTNRSFVLRIIWCHENEEITFLLRNLSMRMRVIICDSSIGFNILSQWEIEHWPLFKFLLHSCL